MHTNRISGLFSKTQLNERAVASAPAATGFVLCPMAIMVVLPWQLAIYQQAFERAKAQVESARPQRRFVECWN
jgi:hypothetical protein